MPTSTQVPAGDVSAPKSLKSLVRPLNVGIITQSYYPRYGGVTENVHHTAVELRRRGHRVVIVTAHFRAGEGRYHQDVERIGYNMLIPANGAFADFTLGLTLKGELRRLFEKHDFDLIHTHCPVMPSLPVFASMEATCAQVGTFHTTGGIHLLHDLWAPWLRRNVVEKLDARIAVSKTAEASAAHYYPGEYVIVPNGVDTDRFSPTVEPFTQWREPGTVNLLFVARLDPRKGLDVLLQAMPEVVARTGGKVRLLVIGDSLLRGRFEASVASSVRGHVEFLGHVPSRDLPRWYATGDVFVAPATGLESFGIVLVEAMASGCATVASDLPGFRSVIHPGLDGLMFPPGDVSALAEMLVRLVQDEGRRRYFSAAGRERALAFAWPRITDQIEQVYADVMARRGGRSLAAV